jgi:phosphohistidine phosphatase
MKTLILMRHAKSSWDNPQQLDHDRPLNKRGKRDAPEMGERLAARGVHPDTIVSSSAERAEATARLVMEAANWQAELLIRRELYHATRSAWVSVLRDLSGKSIIAFGHNPGISEVANSLTHAGISMPTAAIAFIEIEIDQWSELDNDSSGELVDLWTPKDEE